MKDEARIQLKASKLLTNIVTAPPEFCGHQRHVLLGYDESDIDTVWYKNSGKPPGPENPLHGFFASPEMLEDHWEVVGSKWTIEHAAHTIGRALGTLIAGGIEGLAAELYIPREGYRGWTEFLAGYYEALHKMVSVTPNSPKVTHMHP